MNNYAEKVFWAAFISDVMFFSKIDSEIISFYI